MDKDIVAEITRTQDDKPFQIQMYDAYGKCIEAIDCDCIGNAIIALAEKFAYDLRALADWQ